MNLALLYFDITDLSGGGGAERFFYDFYCDYSQQVNSKHNMIMVTDGVDNIQKSGRKLVKDNVVKITNYRYFNFRFLRFLNKRGSYFLGNIINAVIVYRVIKKFHIDKLIVPFYSPREFYFYKTLNLLGVKADYFIVDCRIPDNYESNKGPYFFRDTYSRFFHEIHFDNIHTWYKQVEIYIKERSIIAHYKDVFSYQSRYTRISPEFDLNLKKKILVFASRLDEQKDPFYFLEAVKILMQQRKISEWEIQMFGKGPLEEKVKLFVMENNLTCVKLMVSGDLESTFRQSRVFVSTQKYDNFPSLAISEAMSKGNVIIAKNVGQTKLLVKEGSNGWLSDENNPASLAEFLDQALNMPDEAYVLMAKSSIELMTKEHTFEKFVNQFDEFVCKNFDN